MVDQSLFEVQAAVIETGDVHRLELMVKRWPFSVDGFLRTVSNLLKQTEKHSRLFFRRSFRNFVIFFKYLKRPNFQTVISTYTMGWAELAEPRLAE